MFRTPTSTRALVAMLAVLGMFATGCGMSLSTPAEETSAAPDPMPSMVANTVDGGQIDFGALAGQDVVLWYWAPW